MPDLTDHVERDPRPLDDLLAHRGRYPGVLSLVDPDGVVWGQFLPPFDVMLLTARYPKRRVGR